MAIGYTARGTGSFKDALQTTYTLVITGVSAAAGSELIVGIGHSTSDAPAISVTAGSASLTARKQQGTSGGLYGEEWSLDVASLLSGVAVTITFDPIQTPPTVCAAFVTEGTGAASPGVDATAGASGTSTSPSSGATATLAQANELCIGVIVTSGPSTDAAGTPSNGYTAGQRVGTTGGGDVTVAEIYKIVSSTSAQTFAKTSITSRAWRALGATYKEASAPAPTTVALERGSATSTGNAVVAAPGALSLAVGRGSSTSTGRATVASMGALSLALGKGASTSTGRATVAAPGPLAVALGKGAATTLGYAIAATDSLMIALGVGSASATGYDLGATYREDYPIITADHPAFGLLEGPTTVAQQIPTQSIGLTSKAKPYFALVSPPIVQYVPNLGYHSEDFLDLDIALDVLPKQHASASEIHWLVCSFDASGAVISGIGVTPAGAMVVWSPNRAELRTAAGVFVADGERHSIRVQWGTFYDVAIYADSALVVGATLPYRSDAQVAPVRWMAHNGPDGLARVKSTIFRIGINPADNHAIQWWFNEGRGGLIKALEDVGLLSSDWEYQPANSDYTYPGSTPINFDLTALWLDPSQYGQPRLYGNAPPDSDLGSAYTWDYSTRYGREKPTDPGYGRRDAPGNQFQRRSPSNPNYRTR